MKIKGENGTAKVFTDHIEDMAIKQIGALMDSDIVNNAQVRIMPDVHFGKGSTIGTTIRPLSGTLERINPDLVGVDIGCGVALVELGRKVKEEELPRLDAIINACVPSGMNIHDTDILDIGGMDFADFGREIEIQRIFNELKMPLSQQDKTRVALSVGTLGSGNHFVELLEDEKSSYLAVHTGSRMLGARIHKHYQKLAEKQLDRAEGLQGQIVSLIERLKHEDRAQEIETSIQKLKSEYVSQDSMPYLEGLQLELYMSDVLCASIYARLNRKEILRAITTLMGWDAVDLIDSPHNYIDSQNVLRKGATASYEGYDVIIPINMRDGMLVGKGLGNPDWNYSAPHGAGRQLSRRKAKEQLDFADFQEQMIGVYSTSVVESTLDEAPDAYKPLSNLLENISDTVDIQKHLKPVYNFKAK